MQLGHQPFHLDGVRPDPPGDSQLTLSENCHPRVTRHAEHVLAGQNIVGILHSGFGKEGDILETEIAGEVALVLANIIDVAVLVDVYRGIHQVVGLRVSPGLVRNVLEPERMPHLMGDSPSHAVNEVVQVTGRIQNVPAERLKTYTDVMVAIELKYDTLSLGINQAWLTSRLKSMVSLFNRLCQEPVKEEVGKVENVAEEVTVE